MEPKRYATAAAFRRALEDRLQAIAGKESVDLQRCGVKSSLTGSWRDCFRRHGLARYLGYLSELEIVEAKPRESKRRL